MAGRRCSFPPDRVTFEGCCEDWIRWVTEFESIESQRTDQAELSASQDYRDIQSEIKQLQGRLQQLQDALQQRLRAHETATKENQQLFQARLKIHLRNILPTNMLHLLQEASLGGEDHDQHDQAPLCISRDGIQEPITPPVPRADVKRATLDSLAAAALLYHDDIVGAAGPAEFPRNFKQNFEADIVSSVETTVPGRESAETDLVESMDFPLPPRPEHALNHNQESSLSQKQFKCLDPKCNRLGWARPEHLNRHVLICHSLDRVCYLCIFCNKSFNRRDNWLDHLYKHTQERGKKSRVKFYPEAKVVYEHEMRKCSRRRKVQVTRKFYEIGQQ